MMKKAGVFLASVVLSGACLLPASAYWQSRRQVSVSGAVSSYVGPGNIVSGAWAYWGTRCYTATYAGNVMDVQDAATGTTAGTRLQCDGAGNVVALASGSACTWVTGNACSPLATTCATSCKVLVLYNQAGTTNCNGPVSCDWLNGTLSQHPVLNLTCQNSKPCLVGSTSTIMYQDGSGGATAAQPFTIAGVYMSTTTPGAGAPQRVTQSASNVAGLDLGTSGYGTYMYDGTPFSVVVSAAHHSLIYVYDNTASKVSIDGAAATTGNIGGTEVFGGGGLIFLATYGPGNNFVGNFLEIGVWPGGMTSGVSCASQAACFTAMAANQQAYWAY